MKKLLVAVLAAAFAATAFAQAQKAQPAAPAAPKGQTGVETQKATPATPSAKSSKEEKQKVAKGKTNAEVGVILQMSGRTVQKHLEHVYEKLGVGSRTTATVRALGMLGIDRE